MKKLDELKEALAKEKGYETWTKCINDHPNCMVETLMDIVALRLYNVSISVERANNYGRQQFNRGVMDLDLVKFEDWQH